MTPYGDDWIDEDEYPDDHDIKTLGDDAPFDNDPLTIGYLRNKRRRFWTTGRILLLILSIVIVASLLLPTLLSAVR